MDRMKEMDMLEERAWEDIRQLLKKENLTPVEWENIGKVMCVLEKLTIMSGMDTYFDDDSYSQAPSRHMRYSGHSYERGRSAVSGRYISRDSGYSGHSIKDRMIDRLEKMMDEAKSEYERQQISEEISRIRMESRAN